MRKLLLLALILLVLQGFKTEDGNGFTTVKNQNGPTLGYSPKSGINILTVKGLKFKDLNRNGKLDKYEDWRLPIDVRAQDLAKRLTVEQIAGLMLYSSHQAIPANEEGHASGHYDGKTFLTSNAKPWELTDEQKKFLKDDKLRHILITKVADAETAAKWNNEVQAFLESVDFGIPGNTSSDPRHTASSDVEFSIGSQGVLSLWPRELGLTATFDPDLVETFGKVASAEYRALGIATALSPQVDLCTDPRWYRLGMTFGEDSKLASDIARAYIDGFQTSMGSDEVADGWGYQSVNAMVKHWPGGGSGEGGRDAHWAYGKFAVYPGNCFEEHLKPFTEGAFKLNHKTKMASAVMPYYTISYNQAKDGANVGNSFSKYMITDLLRGKYGYEGVVCTDWRITGDEGQNVEEFKGKPWGVEKLTVAQRHYEVLMAGVDQFGGNNEKGPVLEAYEMGVKKYGEAFMRKRFEQSAVRLLRNIFRVGLFENPYLDPQESAKIVGNPDFMKAGYEAQVKSTVMLKNKNNVMPVKARKTVYIPKTFVPSVKNFFRIWTQPSLEYPVDLKLVNKYYDVTTDPNKADFALVFVSNPKSENGGYSVLDRAAGGNGYVPISLQYDPYTAHDAREHSVAAGDPVVDPSITDRSYKSKSTRTNNSYDLDIILRTRDMMKDKPVIVVVDLNNPMVFGEFEKAVDGILIRFGSLGQSILDIVSGKYEPSGLLPVQMPANMSTVEKQYEDKPLDMECYRDDQGHTYDFAYGMNWKGVINDARTAKYKVK